MLLGLFGMGFGIGLSGALIPGPLLAFTITESVKRGAKTGLLVITGHFVVEVIVVFLIILGFLRFLSSPVLAGIGGIAGAALLFITGILLIKQKGFSTGNTTGKTYSPIIGGIIFTVFNPTFPPWWATVGYNMLWEGIRRAGAVGLVFILIGHWASDFGWYALVSTAVAKGKDVILREKVYPVLKIVMALFMFFLGLYFLIRAVNL